MVKKTNNSKVLVWVLIILILVGILGFVVWYFFLNNTNKNSNHDVKLNVVDVGQGSMSVVETNDKLIVIDTGDDLSKVKTYYQNFFANNSQYKNTIDYVLISHPDADHLQGFKWMCNTYIVKYVYMPRVFCSSLEWTKTDKDGIAPIKSKETNIYEGVFEAISEKGIEWEYFDNNDLNDIESIKIVESEKSDWSDWNDFSPFIFINYSNDKYICIGNDAERQKEKWYVDNNIKYNCPIYIMNHHGSGTSSSFDFVNSLKPEIAIYSSYDPSGTQYGHPNINALNTIVKFTSNIYGTEFNNDIVIEFNDGEYKLKDQYQITTTGWTGKNGQRIDITY